MCKGINGVYITYTQVKHHIITYMIISTADDNYIVAYKKSLYTYEHTNKQGELTYLSSGLIRKNTTGNL